MKEVSPEKAVEVLQANDYFQFSEGNSFNLNFLNDYFQGLDTVVKHICALVSAKLLFANFLHLQNNVVLSF
jgi:hypothetical protein